MGTRIERDALGERAVPEGAYWGIQTLRALENFPISGLRADREVIRAYGLVKQAAALANHEFGTLDAERARLISEAARAVAAGDFDMHLPVDVFQAGAGTSFHMNVNEVIANRASELAGRALGDYSFIHPNDHVNMSQSTNDTFPSVMRMACVAKGRRLALAVARLSGALAAKADELDDVITSGRTHLQDAVPITYGQVFRGYSRAVEKGRERLEAAIEALLELPLGGTAVGTGLNSPAGYAARVVEHVARLAGEPFRPGRDLVELMASMGDLVAFSSTLRDLALEIGKICDDLRLLVSGPNTGLRDLLLPAVQPGSSIMPGKVNPSILEMVNQVCFQVAGNDHAVALAGRAGQLQLNVMMPGMIFALTFSLEILTSAVDQLAARAVAGIDADRERCAEHFHRSAALATLLNPIIGYAQAAEIAKEAVRTGRPVVDLIVEKHVLTREELERVLDPGRVTGPSSS